MPSFLSPMGWYWTVAPVAVALFGVLFLVFATHHVVRGRPLRGTTHALFGALLLLAGLALGLVALNTQTFVRLSHERDVAIVRIGTIDRAHDLYRVTVSRTDGAPLTTPCTLQGDEWEISARVQKWKEWLNVLGVDATYTLGQISNKYFDAERGNGKRITACDLRAPAPAVNAYVPESWLKWLMSRSYAEKRHFGSATYMPLANGAEYRVLMTQSGLNAEPRNDIARKANDVERP